MVTKGSRVGRKTVEEVSDTTVEKKVTGKLIGPQSRVGHKSQSTSLSLNGFTFLAHSQTSLPNKLSVKTGTTGTFLGLKETVEPKDLSGLVSHPMEPSQIDRCRSKRTKCQYYVGLYPPYTGRSHVKCERGEGP